jgi:hypothetical protein
MRLNEVVRRLSMQLADVVSNSGHLCEKPNHYHQHYGGANGPHSLS